MDVYAQLCDALPGDAEALTNLGQTEQRRTLGHGPFKACLLQASCDAFDLLDSGP